MQEGRLRPERALLSVRTSERSLLKESVMGLVAGLSTVYSGMKRCSCQKSYLLLLPNI